MSMAAPRAKHYNEDVLRSWAPPGNGLSVGLTAHFSVRCPSLLAQGRQAIRGTSAGQQVQLAIAVKTLIGFHDLGP